MRAVSYLYIRIQERVSIILFMWNVISVLNADGMFRGIYHGKQYHAADIAAVLSRAWSAGVQRIIVSFFILFCNYPLFGYSLPFLVSLSSETFIHGLASLMLSFA